MSVGILGRPELDRAWDMLAERLQRNGLQPTGTIVLADLDRGERHAVAGLLGRPVPGERVTIDLAALDRRLRASGVTGGLVAAVAARRGPLVNRPGERSAQHDARMAVWHAGRAALDDTGLGGAAWVEAWLDDVRRAGPLGRMRPAEAAATLTLAVRCIARLPAPSGEPPYGRGDLASAVAGDAHALDDGTILASLVLRAAAAMTGCPYPSTPAGRRELWRLVGVSTDEVSTTVLTVGLRSRYGGTWLDDRTAAGWETHLNARDLRRVELGPPGDVFVCENPRVLETAVERGVAGAGLCTQGQPAVVVLRLVDMLGELGATLHYHGDFDWPGVAIANTMIGGRGCVPWRFGAGEYESALARLAPGVGRLPALEGRPVEACWDPDLTPTMSRAARVVHEELLLDDLLADLVAAAVGRRAVRFRSATMDPREARDCDSAPHRDGRGGIGPPQPA